MSYFVSIVLGVVVSLLCVQCRVQKLSLSFDEEAEDLETFMKLISKPRHLDRHRLVHKGREPALLGFTWKNCGKSTDLLQISAMSVSPDPIELPGNLTVSFSAKILKNVTAPLTVKLSIEKKVFGVFLPIPCVDNVGSCTYEDICSLIPFKPGQTCPAPLPKYNLPCTCPFSQGSYSLPTITEYADVKNLPSFLADGDYKVTAELSIGQTAVGCYEIDASLKA